MVVQTDVGAGGPLRWTLLNRDDLIRWREAQGYTHRDVALLLGVSRRTCGHYESGHRVPSRELQARMVELIRGAEVAPRAHRHRPKRRHRWRHVKPAELREWRERADLTRDQVAEILQVHPSTISGWERDEWAPPPDTQRRLKSLVGSRPLNAVPQPTPRVEGPVAEPTRPPSLRAHLGYHNVGAEGVGTVTVAIEPRAETPPESVAATTELGIRRRVEAVMVQLNANELRLPNVYAECRWGEKDGIAIIKSKELGAVYLFDQSTGSFYRTVSPQSNRLCASSPREVLSEDRSWLYRLFDKIPGGKFVVHRYHHNTASMSPTREEKSVTTPAAAAPAPPTPAQAATQAASDRLLDFQEVEAKRVVLVATTKLVELGPHQIHALMRKTGATFPDAAEVRPLAPSGFMVEWSLTKDTKVGRYYDTEASGVERLKVTPEQLVGLFALLGKKIEKPVVTFTPQNYVKIEWTENRYEEA